MLDHATAGMFTSVVNASTIETVLDLQLMQQVNAILTAADTNERIIDALPSRRSDGVLQICRPSLATLQPIIAVFRPMSTTERTSPGSVEVGSRRTRRQ